MQLNCKEKISENERSINWAERLLEKNLSIFFGSIYLLTGIGCRRLGF